MTKDVRLQSVLAVVSHDLRGPLHAISLALEGLREEVGPGGLRYLASIERASHRAEKLISDLLEAHRIETGSLELETRAIDATAIVRQVVSDHTQAAHEAGCPLTSALPADPTLVQADRDRVVQALTCLVSNALKFGRGTPVTLELRTDATDAVFVVRDGGPGIAAAELPHVFDRYWPGRVKRGGSGLGLAIAAGIVAAHGGRIDAANRDPGAELAFRLPLASAG